MASRANRRQTALTLGATPQSEHAVDLALQWIVKQQNPNGSWYFDPGKQAPNGATGMALLALLGAGNTHLEGRYRSEVNQGLRYLIKRQAKNGSFHESYGRMYSHGLVTLALCEVLAMTRYQDHRPISGREQIELRVGQRELTAAAQSAISFIEFAQGKGGGWRYTPKQVGDTSVVGWQMMALKSGDLAGLQIAPKTIDQAKLFLDNASMDKIGSCYAYQRGGKQPYIAEGANIGATTPIGLLCRMYTGWEHDRPGISQGVKRIGRWARPNRGMYFYYYATQVMHHYGGTRWNKWNEWMREYLVRTQVKAGEQTGSWKFSANHDVGRMYCTALAAMSLEIYYRYSPIYGQEALASAPMIKLDSANVALDPSLLAPTE